MKNWMKKLALHYDKIRTLYPDDKLIILFDIDGTILDMRHMILHVLKLFDENHSTSFFKKLKASDITVHENQVENLLSQLKIPQDYLQKILDWYTNCRWSSNAILESHRPFIGVMEVIRWFQIQPNTFTGLNTGRPEFLRAETLRSLNKLGDEYKVIFKNEFLHMNPYGWDKDVIYTKIAGVHYFQRAGYRIFAFVDNEPENLKAVSDIDSQNEILLLHADTIFETKRKKLPHSSVSGKNYDITELIREKSLPRHVQFVWHGVNDEVNLRQFLSSNVRWAECDVRMDSTGNEIILRHDSFAETPLQEDEDSIVLEDILKLIRKAEKSIKLDLKENGFLIHNVIEILRTNRLDDSQLWFNGEIEVIKEEGFRKLAKAFPSAILQCPVDFLVPLIFSAPEKAKDVLKMLRDLGINRLSINWEVPRKREFLDRIKQWGFEVNIYNVPDLETFLKAILLLPKSITSDFNFPKWHYYGRGSGEHREHYEYAIQSVPYSSCLQ